MGKGRQDAGAENVGARHPVEEARGPAAAEVAPKLLSPLFAERSTTDRCKSFISIHSANQGGGGGTSVDNFVYLFREGLCGSLIGYPDVHL
jgi:hypothetical protein